MRVFPSSTAISSSSGYSIASGILGIALFIGEENGLFNTDYKRFIRHYL
jgi:hypothetical protein